MDITYIPMRRGFVYLAAVLDWATRRVLAWRLSNSLTADFCVDALEEAIRDYGRPEIMNTDQGSQFTGTAFIGVLQQHGIQISMDGKGGWRDNVFVERLWKSVKYEEVYLHAYDTVTEARQRPGALLRLLQPGPARIRLLTARLRIWSTLPRCPSSRQRNVHPGRASLKNASLPVQLPGATAHDLKEQATLHGRAVDGVPRLNVFARRVAGHVGPPVRVLVSPLPFLEHVGGAGHGQARRLEIANHVVRHAHPLGKPNRGRIAETEIPRGVHVHARRVRHVADTVVLAGLRQELPVDGGLGDDHRFEFKLAGELLGKA